MYSSFESSLIDAGLPALLSNILVAVPNEIVLNVLITRFSKLHKFCINLSNMKIFLLQRMQLTPQN